MYFTTIKDSIHCFTGFIAFVSLISLIHLLIGCGGNAESRTAVIYTSVDQVYSEPVLEKFETDTGMDVQVVYDVEASKTTGLVNRLIAEKDNPQADIFWNGEFAQTIRLKNEGVLEKYESPAADDIPEQFRDEDGYWTGLAGRARVIIVNTELLSPDEYPRSVDDLLNDRYEQSEIGIAYPIFGTTATHAAALYAILGRDEAFDFFTRIAESGMQVVDGNSVVRDMVVSGQLKMGLTDTDDACAAIMRGEPVEVVFPDQREGDIGTLIIPGSVALIENSPNPETAKQLYDYLVGPEVENMLIESGWCHIPMRQGGSGPQCYGDLELMGMQVDFEAVYARLEQSSSELREIFVR